MTERYVPPPPKKGDVVSCITCAGTGRRGWVPGPQTDQYDTCPKCAGAGVVRYGRH